MLVTIQLEYHIFLVLVWERKIKVVHKTTIYLMFTIDVNFASDTEEQRTAHLLRARWRVEYVDRSGRK
jgi:hypothetical protein